MAKERQTNQIMVRVTDSELRRIEKRAGYEPLASWARRILLEYCERAERRAKR